MISNKKLTVKVSYPLKQGLKHLQYKNNDSSRQVKVSYPLKQGLKPKLLFIISISSSVVKVSYPLKQGLKQSAVSYKVQLKNKLK